MSYRAFAFACAVIAAIAVARSLSDRMSQVSASLVALCMISNPLLATQTELMSMEILLAPCVGLLIVLIKRQRYAWAVLPCLLAFLIKNSAAILTASVLVFALLQPALTRMGLPRLSRRKYVVICMSYLGLLLGEIGTMWWSNVLGERLRNDAVRFELLVCFTARRTSWSLRALRYSISSFWFARAIYEVPVRQPSLPA